MKESQNNEIINSANASMFRANMLMASIHYRDSNFEKAEELSTIALTYNSESSEAKFIQFWSRQRLITIKLKQ